jgi:hypothetical protein
MGDQRVISRSRSCARWGWKWVMRVGKRRTDEHPHHAAPTRRWCAGAISSSRTRHPSRSGPPDVARFEGAAGSVWFASGRQSSAPTWTAPRQRCTSQEGHRAHRAGFPQKCLEDSAQRNLRPGALSPTSTGPPPPVRAIVRNLSPPPRFSPLTVHDSLLAP